MSFKLIENFEGLTANQSVSGQKSAGGQVWCTAGSSTVKDEFKVVTLDGKKVLWCYPT
jgi:hypothetical protein